MRIVYVQYTNPAAYPPLEHSSRILARAGWSVLFLGTGALGADSLTFSEHPNIQVRRLAFCPAGVRQKLHYIFFSIWVLAWVAVWRPAWVYASDSLACPVALLLTMIPGLRVIYHEHDSPTPGRGANRLALWARKRLANRVQFSILPNEVRGERFRADLGQPVSRVHTVWNCPAAEEISAPREPVHEDDIVLLYHGSVAPSRLPLTVLTAMASLPRSVRLRVVGYETAGSEGYGALIAERARALGIADRVEILGAIPSRADMLQQCRRSDIGLALMPMTADDINMTAMAGASNKVFDYMACGLPVLVSDLPDWTTLYVDPGYALVCDPANPASIAHALRVFLDAPARIRAMGERGRTRIATDWNYETQFAKVWTELESGAPLADAREAQACS